MWISPSFHLKVIRVFEEYATNGMVMKPEVVKQAFDDPKVFMAKALMLAQETLENCEMKAIFRGFPKLPSTGSKRNNTKEMIEQVEKVGITTFP